MKRAITAAAALIIVALVVVLLATGTVAGGSGGYQVQARFNNAGLAVPGEQVRIAGANVGTVGALTVTNNNLASVTLKIKTKGFSPWYANATCTIRPQSLIGERYVDCSPGTSSNPKLRKIKRGTDAGQFLLPVDRTSSPIDTDIVQDISQDSVRQSLSVILNELGTGLAARGSDLNQVILRANPALGQTEKVFNILAGQDKTLAELATNAKTVLAPLAKSRKSLADFIGQANTVAAATASQKTQLERSIALLPNFLTQLKPLMADLGRLARNGTPDVQALGSSAGSLNTTFKELVPFASKAQTALQNLGDAAQNSEGSLEASLPLAQELKRVGASAKPSAALLAKLSGSLSKSGAIQQLMGLLFYSAGASNGYDADGHYARISPVVGSCTGYARSFFAGCGANFTSASAAADADGTTETPQQITREATAAADQVWQGNTETASSSSTTTSSSPDLKAAEETTAQIAKQAVAAATAKHKKVSDQALSGLLRYLMGGGS